MLIKKIRKYLYNLYMKEMCYCKLRKQKKKYPKKVTLGQARVTYCHTDSEEL